MVRQDVQSVFLRSKGIKCIKVRFFLLTSILHCGLEISLRAIARGFESLPLRQKRPLLFIRARGAFLLWLSYDFERQQKKSRIFPLFLP